MIRVFKRTMLLLVMVSGLLSPLVAMPAIAAPVDDACEGLASVDPTATCTKDAAQKKFSSVVQDVINVLSIVVGAVSVIMIIIGGFRYVTSNGDSGSLGGAKNTIIYAIVGLVIVFFAQTIVRFVLTQL